MIGEIVLWVSALALVGGGIAGLLFPVLPGAPMVFAGLALAAWAEDFAHVGGGTLALLGILALLTYVADFLAGAFGARTFGASRRAVAGAALGAVVGVFFGIPGVLLGPFAGAFLGELSARTGLKTAGRAGFGAALGMALGIAAKLALALAMVGIFVVVRVF